MSSPCTLHFFSRIALASFACDQDFPHVTSFVLWSECSRKAAPYAGQVATLHLKKETIGWAKNAVDYCSLLGSGLVFEQCANPTTKSGVKFSMSTVASGRVLLLHTHVLMWTKCGPVYSAESLMVRSSLLYFGQLSIVRPKRQWHAQWYAQW